MLGEKIRNYRSWGGYRIETLAKMLGITRQTLTKWEQGITIPDVISMKKNIRYFRRSDGKVY